MLKNYFKIALRGFRKHKLFTFINVIGLSIGISASLVIYLIVHYDLTFNKFAGGNDGIYRVTTEYAFSGEVGYNSGVCTPLTEAIKTDISGIEKSAPFYTLYEARVQVPHGKGEEFKLNKENGIVIADGRYFNLFKYNWVAGNAKTSLSQPYQVVLTESQAKKYFPGMGYQDMIGREIVYEDSVRTNVSGVVADLKGNTDFLFHDFISFKTADVDSLFKGYFQPTEWGSTNSASQLFVKLDKNTAATNVIKQLNVLRNKRAPQKADKANYTKFDLEKLDDLHFDQKYYSFDGARTANRSTLYGLLIIAAFLLLLGCINFINLTTAQASQRAKEIGIRKTMGSGRGQLIMQFMSETFLVTLFAVIISVALTPLILKLFSTFIPDGVKPDLLQPNLLLFLAGLTVVVSVLSGFYPALVLSNYKPVVVLKSQVAPTSGNTRKTLLRKSLTVTQFVIAQFFIMATILVGKQIHYALTKDMGFKKDAILIVTTPYKSARTNKKQVFLNKIRSMPQIKMIAVGGDAPLSGGTHSTEVTYKNGKTEVKTDLQQKFGDENYLKIYDIKLLAGRNLTPADTGRATVINATYAKTLGFKNVADAVGITLDYNDKKREIVGVMKDFNQKSLRSQIKPLAFIEPQRFSNRVLHIALKPQTAGGKEWKTAIAGMEHVWKELYPEEEFSYTFFDDSIAKFYESEQQTSTLLSWATGLSILISCLGLLGLAMYTTSLRTKEIGVRKVLGATVAQIVTLLSTELIWLIVLAFIVVTPIAYYAMHKWMENFADRTNISWWIFALSGMGMLLIALFTLSFQTIRAAIANPVRSLRSE
ncbi:ABC transporter permease [Mucilaginibacter conchicola]|uniref:ABC transporter permease n=1 Tax=Mucilaginibacter conchicola TaxID=2303333 RepID=A0A372NXE0_9SPHI|nr:ABC transporter permease [Mucilaginibacter conchicola]RFZ94197.1 ABC transporter permease [Mucilaginibacter conchicola]